MGQLRIRCARMDRGTASGTYQLKRPEWLPLSSGIPRRHASIRSSGCLLSHVSLASGSGLAGGPVLGGCVCATRNRINDAKLDSPGGAFQVNGPFLSTASWRSSSSTLDLRATTSRHSRRAASSSVNAVETRAQLNRENGRFRFAIIILRHVSAPAALSPEACLSSCLPRSLYSVHQNVFIPSES